jgi:hypothetical protein
MGKLLDRYQSQFAGKAEDTNADDRAEAARIQEAHAVEATLTNSLPNSNGIGSRIPSMRPE